MAGTDHAGLLEALQAIEIPGIDVRLAAPAARWDVSLAGADCRIGLVAGFPLAPAMADALRALKR